MNALQKMTPIQNALGISEIFIRPYRMLLDKFKPRILIYIERDDYIIKTAETCTELEQALHLRHDVFYNEIIGTKLLFDIDIDRFDTLCDHLIIIDRKTDNIIGTYRLISSTFSNDFYSEGEFDIADIKRLEGIKLELGRACIDRKYRNGQTIVLLWLGLYEYINKIQAKYLFGCSSVNTVDFSKIALIQLYLQQHHYSQPHIRVRPNKKYRLKDLSSIMSNFEPSSLFDKKTAKLIPGLLNSYLAVGARICGEPAYDREFKCMDYLTILDVEAMNRGYVDKVFGTC